MKQRGWWVNTFAKNAALKQEGMGKANGDDVQCHPDSEKVSCFYSMPSKHQSWGRSLGKSYISCPINTVYLGAYVCPGLLQSVSSTLGHTAGLSNVQRHKEASFLLDNL